MLPFIEKVYIWLNSLCLLNLIPRYFLFNNYQDSLKSSLYQVFLKINVKKQPQKIHRYFPVNIKEFLKTFFFKEHLQKTASGCSS